MTDGRTSWLGQKLAKATHCFEHSGAMRNKNHEHWISRIFSVFLLYRSSRFCNLVFFVENKTWQYSHGYMSCFVKVWNYWCPGRGSNAYRDYWANVDTTNIDEVGQNQYQHLVCYVPGLSVISFINNCFECKDDRRTTNKLFSIFVQQVLICLREGV